MSPDAFLFDTTTTGRVAELRKRDPSPAKKQEKRNLRPGAGRQVESEDA